MKMTTPLSGSEQQYLTILNSLSDAMHVVDKDLRIIFQNPAMIQWLEELNLTSDNIGKSVFEAFPFLSYNKVYNEYDKVFEGGDLLITREITKLVNRTCYTETLKIPIKIEGKVSQIITVLRDITIQKEAEAKLIASEEKYKNIINHLMDVIIILDLKGNFQYISPQVYEISGFKPEEMIGKSGFKFMHPDDIKNAAEVLKEAMVKKKRVNIEYRTIHKEGYYIYLSASGRIVNIDGEDRIFAVVRDISEHKIAEQKLKESEQKYKYLIENSIEGVWVIDQHANTVLVNPSMAEMLGYIVEDMIGKSLFLFMEDKVTQETKFSLEKRKQGISEIRDTEMIHRNGNKVYLRLRATPIFNIDGNYDGTYAFLTDITQQKLAEKKLKESEEKQRLILENANDLITILNQDFKHEYINEKAYYDLLGYTSDDLIGQSPLSYLHPNDIDKAANILREGYEKGSGMYVFRIKAKNGQYKWLESRGTTFIDLDGKKKGIIISRDFTESKKADQKLRESEEKYRSLFENMNAGFAFHKVITDDNNKPIDYEYIEVNPIFEKLTGLKKEELIGKRVTEAIPGTENDPADWIGRFGNVGLTGVPLTVEEYSEAIKKWFTVSGYSPRKGYFAVTFTDITDIKRAEQKLKESEEQFRTIAEQSFMGIIILQDGLFKYFNKQAAKINGYTMEEIQNWEPYEFKKIIHPEDREFVMEQARKKQMGDPDVVTHYQYRVVTKNGQVIWVDNFSKTINYKGKPADFVMTIDISDKIKAEQQLKESEENFRNIAEQAFMGIMIIQDDKLEYINNALLQTFEFSHEEVESWRTNDLIKLIYPEDLQDLREYRLKLQGGESDTKPYYSYRVFTKYGRIKWIDQFSKPIIYRGRPAELITIMDITEKKKAEEELIKLNSLKSELLRRTSHELKTPLVSIKGFSDLLLTVHKEKLDDYVLATIHEIRLGCERLESLIQDILKTAELESDSVELKKSEEDLSFLIKLCVKELRGLIKLRNHEINLEIHDKLITHFEPDQIHLVISNILNNAIKYTPPNGKIEIRSALRDDSILISVHDNGIGLTYEEKKRLFSQFGKIERYGQGLDIISDGSGLGLFITKKIVELHGGRIWVRSKGRNKGSTFYFTLPLIVKNKA